MRFLLYLYTFVEDMIIHVTLICSYYIFSLYFTTLFGLYLNKYCADLNAFHAAGKCRRQVRNVNKFGKKGQNCGISWPYLEPSWEINLNKYKHACYWFTNLRNSCKNVRKQTQFFSVKPIPCVVSVDMTSHKLLKKTKYLEENNVESQHLSRVQYAWCFRLAVG